MREDKRILSLMAVKVSACEVLLTFYVKQYPNEVNFKYLFAKHSISSDTEAFENNDVYTPEPNEFYICEQYPGWESTRVRWWKIRDFWPETRTLLIEEVLDNTSKLINARGLSIPETVKENRNTGRFRTMQLGKLFEEDHEKSDLPYERFQFWNGEPQHYSDYA